VILCHLDRTSNKMEAYDKLAKYGCFLELDLFRLMFYYPSKLTTFPVPSDEGGSILLKDPIKTANLDRLLISHDTSSRFVLPNLVDMDLPIY